MGVVEERPVAPCLHSTEPQILTVIQLKIDPKILCNSSSSRLVRQFGSNDPLLQKQRILSSGFNGNQIDNMQRQGANLVLAAAIALKNISDEDHHQHVQIHFRAFRNSNRGCAPLDLHNKHIQKPAKSTGPGNEVSITNDEEEACSQSSLSKQC